MTYIDTFNQFMGQNSNKKPEGFIQSCVQELSLRRKIAHLVSGMISHEIYGLILEKLSSTQKTLFKNKNQLSLRTKHFTNSP